MNQNDFEDIYIWVAMLLGAAGLLVVFITLISGTIQFIHDPLGTLRALIAALPSLLQAFLFILLFNVILATVPQIMSAIRRRQGPSQQQVQSAALAVRGSLQNQAALLRQRIEALEQQPTQTEALSALKREADQLDQVIQLIDTNPAMLEVVRAAVVKKSQIAALRTGLLSFASNVFFLIAGWLLSGLVKPTSVLPFLSR